MPGIIGGMDIADLSRLLENLIRVGTIHSVDHEKRRARVQSGRLVTGWLRWLERRAGTTTTWDPPTMGEQCVILSPSGVPEQGIIIYGIPSDVIDTPSHNPVEHVVRFTDGGTFSYDHSASKLTVTGIKTFVVQASESGVFDCPNVTFTGNVMVEEMLTVEGLFTYLNGLRGSGGTSGNGNAVTGDFIHTDGDLISNDVTLHTHQHTGVEAGDDLTGEPYK